MLFHDPQEKQIQIYGKHIDRQAGCYIAWLILRIHDFCSLGAAFWREKHQFLRLCINYNVPDPNETPPFTRFIGYYILAIRLVLPTQAAENPITCVVFPPSPLWYKKTPQSWSVLIYAAFIPVRSAIRPAMRPKASASRPAAKGKRNPL